MFDNAGKKIENFASFAFDITVIITIVMAMVFIFLIMAVPWPYYYPKSIRIMLLIALVVDAGVIIFFSYLFFLMYAGFGQLVSNTAKSAADTGTIVSRTEHSSSEHGQTIIVDNSIKSNELPDL